MGEPFKSFRGVSWWELPCWPTELPEALVLRLTGAHPGVPKAGGDMDSKEADGRGDRRPMSVRAAMESSEPEVGDRAPELRHVLDPKSEQEWVVRISGRATSGVIPLRVIPLMEVNFSKAEAPEVPLSRAISQGESLDELDDASLLALLKSSGPMESKRPAKSPSQGNDRRGKARRGPRR
jgi:hypothetical protein